MEIRQLAPDDWQVVRAFRLAALQERPGSFFASHAEEATLTEQDWRARLGSATSAIFGLFDGAQMIGLTGVFTDDNDPSGRTAVFGMSSILPAYRRRGLADLLYTTRLDWVRARPFTRVINGHRASNLASQRAMLRHGFVRTISRPHRWPDGTDEDDVEYELLL